MAQKMENLKSESVCVGLNARPASRKVGLSSSPDQTWQGLPSHFVLPEGAGLRGVGRVGGGILVPVKQLKESHFHKM